MKELATFFGKGGETVAFLFEGDNIWKVNYGGIRSTPHLPGNILSTKTFATEQEATEFISDFINGE
jgi:hypothetical protein